VACRRVHATLALGKPAAGVERDAGAAKDFVGTAIGTADSGYGQSAMSAGSEPSSRSRSLRR